MSYTLFCEDGGDGGLLSLTQFLIALLGNRIKYGNLKNAQNDNQQQKNIDTVRHQFSELTICIAKLDTRDTKPPEATVFSRSV